MHPVSTICVLLLAAALTLPATAAPTPAAPPTPAPAAPVAPQASPLGVAATDAQLDSARGGTDTTDIDTKLSGTVSGNSATNVNTGANIITNGSFANMAGIPIVVQNTGANVLIQSATVINLRMN